NRAHPVHPAHAGGQFKRTQNIVHWITVGVTSVGALRLPGSNHAAPVLSRELIPSGAAGKAAGQDSVQPLFQQRRTAPRIERMLKNDHLMLTQEILLMGNIDKKIWVVRIKV